MDTPFFINYEKLPVYSQKQKILSALESHQVVVVESNTGSGKTTQIPVILHEAGYTADGKVIGMTQPRRIAAFSISDVISAQLHHQYPDLSDDFVRYKIRFDDKTSPRTQIKVITDGILLQEIKHDTLLSFYSVLVIDEAHERSLNIDFILGLLYTICQQRKDLKVIISSATINTEKFSRFFGDAPVISIDAPIYPVDLRYAPVVVPKGAKAEKKGRRHGQRSRRSNSQQARVDESVLIEQIVEIVKQSLSHKEGDILIFLPGEKSIKNCLDKISQLPSTSELLHLLPLYSRLDQKTQEQVFFPSPKGKTKIIAATNIAETSITIENIAVVIDSGRVKLNYFHYHKLSSTLSEVSISKASAIQRRGRAGRTRAGICYRMYSEEEYEQMDEFTQEEILRTDLSEIVLRMAHLNINDFEHFKLVSAPPKNAITTGVALLQDMEALDQNRHITKIGLLMIEFPLSPAHARILVESMEYYPEVLSSVLIILSFLTTPSPFLLPLNEEIEARKQQHAFSVRDSDFFSSIALFQAYTRLAYEEKPGFCESYYLDLRILNEIVNVYTQLSEMVVVRGVFVGTDNNEEKIMKAMIKGLMYNICVQYRASTYLSRTGEKVYIHPGSYMFDAKHYPSIVVAGEIVQTSKTFARALSSCNLSWIKTGFRHLYTELNTIVPLLTSRSYVAQQKIRAKLASSTPLFSISPHSDLNNANIREVSKEELGSHSIMLAGKTFALQRAKGSKHKVLPLTWKDVKELVANDSRDDMKLHGKLRCNISYNVHVCLLNIKLLNVPIMYEVYGDHLSFAPKVIPAINIVNLKKRDHIAHAMDVISHVMDILIPSHSKSHTRHNKKVSAYKFLALDINTMEEIYLLPEGSFISALQTSLHTLGVLISHDAQYKLPSAFKKSTAHLYHKLRHAYGDHLE